MIIYKDWGLKSWQAGRQIWFFAIIKPEYRGKQHIVEHEKTHIKQWWLVTLLTALPVAFAAFVLNKHGGVPLMNLAWMGVIPPSAHAFLYLFFRKYVLWAEVQAYRVSLSYRPDLLDNFANDLATKYKLKISTSEARGLLS